MLKWLTRDIYQPAACSQTLQVEDKGSWGCKAWCTQLTFCFGVCEDTQLHAGMLNRCCLSVQFVFIISQWNIKLPSTCLKIYIYILKARVSCQGSVTFPLMWWIYCRRWELVWCIDYWWYSQPDRQELQVWGGWQGYFFLRQNGPFWCHRQKRREPFLPSSPSPCGIRGSMAERVRPQNRGGDKSFLVAVNFQPMCEPQVRHWAIVQAYLRAKRQMHHLKGLLYKKETVYYNVKKKNNSRLKKKASWWQKLLI